MQPSVTNFFNGDDAVLQKIVQDLKSQDVEIQIAAIAVARRILCCKEPPVSPIVQAGIIPPLLAALDRDDCPKLQYRALGVLSNVAFSSTEYTDTVANSGAVPKIISFLSCEEDLAERAILILGNLSLAGGGAGHAARGGLGYLLRNMQATTPLPLLRTIVRTYSNFCSDCGDDETILEIVCPALPYIPDLLDIENHESLEEDDEKLLFIARDIIVDACTALANIMLGLAESTEAVQAVDGLTARLVALLGHEATNVKIAALSAVGNMLAGTDDQVERCLQANCLEHIISLLQNSNSSLVAEAARAAGNILAGTQDQIQQALDGDMLTSLRNVLAQGDLESRKQAANAMTNLCCNGAAWQHEQLFVSGALQPYCTLLGAPDQDLSVDILNGLDELIQAAETRGDVERLCYMLDAFNVLDHLEILEELTIQEDIRYKIANMSTKLRKHAREYRFVFHDGEVFTAQKIVEDLESLHQESMSRAVGAAYAIFRENYAPVNALMEAGIVPVLTKGLDTDVFPDLRRLAVWALSKITSGTLKHKMAVMNSGAIPKLLALLGQGDEIAILASCSLGNLAPHGPETRNALLDYASSEAALEALRAFAKAYEKTCTQIKDQSGSLQELEHLSQALPFVYELLDIGDREITVEVCWACSWILSHPEPRMIEVAQAVPGLTEDLVALMTHEHIDVQEAASSVVVRMLGGTDDQVERCLQAGCFDPFFALLESSESSIVYRAILAMRIILYHKEGRLVQQAIEKNILSLLLKILPNDDAEIQEEAVLAFSNICQFVSPKQRALVLSSGIFETCCELLSAPTRGPAIADRFMNAIFLLMPKEEEVAKVVALCLKLDNIGVTKKLQQLLEFDIDEDLCQRVVETSAIFRQWARGEHVVVEDGKVFTAADIVQDLNSEDLACQTRAAAAAHAMSLEEDPWKIELGQAGTIAPLVAALDRNDCFGLQSDAASALANMVCGLYEHRVAVINRGAIPKLVALLRHGSKLAPEAARALGYLVQRSPVARDMTLSHGAVTALLPHLSPHTPLDLLTSCLGAYKKICAIIISQSLLEHVSPALPFIAESLKVENIDVLELACDALTSLIHCLDECIEAVQAVPGLITRLVELMGHEAIDVQQSALDAVANMLGGTDEQAKRCHDDGCLEYIVPLLESNESSIVEAATRAVSNIVDHTDSQIQLALDKNILTPILKILADADPNSFIQYYAVNTLNNITSRGTQEQIMAIVNNGAIPNLVAVLRDKEAVAQEAAEALKNIVEDVPETRDLMLGHGTVRALLPNLRRDTPLDLLKTCVQLYETLCEDITTPSQLALLSPGLPFVADLLNFEDQDVMESALRAFAYLANGELDYIEEIQSTPGVVTRTIEMLAHESLTVKTAAWFLFQSMFHGNDVQFNRCVAAGCIERFLACLREYQPYDLEVVMHTLEYIEIASKRMNKLGKNALHSLLKMSNDVLAKAWIPFNAIVGVANITSRGSKKDSKILVTAEVISKLTTALISHEDIAASTAATAIGNLARRHPEAIQLMFVEGTVQKLLPLLHPDTPLDLLSSTLWAYRNFCRHDFEDPMKKLELLSPILEHLDELLDIKNEGILIHVCWSVVSLCKYQECIEALQAVAGLTERLVAIIGHGTPGLRKIVVNVAFLMLSGTETQAIRCFEADCVENMLSYLQCREPDLIAAAAEATRKVFGESHPRITRALDPDVLTPFMRVLDASYTPEDQQRVVQAISKLCRLASAEDRARVLACGVLEPYCALLATPHHFLTIEVLKSLEDLTQLAANDDKLKPFCEKLEEIGILDQMIELLEQQNEEINKKVSSLLNTLLG